MRHLHSCCMFLLSRFAGLWSPSSLVMAFVVCHVRWCTASLSPLRTAFSLPSAWVVRPRELFYRFQGSKRGEVICVLPAPRRLGAGTTKAGITDNNGWEPAWYRLGRQKAEIVNDLGWDDKRLRLWMIKAGITHDKEWDQEWQKAVIPLTPHIFVPSNCRGAVLWVLGDWGVDFFTKRNKHDTYQNTIIMPSFLQCRETYPVSETIRYCAFFSVQVRCIFNYVYSSPAFVLSISPSLCDYCLWNR